MTSKSKDKGKAFEREVANFLSREYNESFTRAPHSGAFTGGKNAYRRETLSEGQVRAHKGDIIPPDGWKHFNAECKSYGKFPFHLLLRRQPVPLLESWIEQTLEAADKGDLNIIFMKFNNLGWFIAYSLDKGKDFITHRHIDYTDKQGNLWRITGFDGFFDHNKQIFQAHCQQ